LLSDHPGETVPIDIDRLDIERVRRSWTKGDLAAAMGVSAITVSGVYRTGRLTPRLLNKLVLALRAKEPDAEADLVLNLGGELIAR
jgi:hypothetical protein